jgi:hypothetical protein
MTADGTRGLSGYQRMRHVIYASLSLLSVLSIQACQLETHPQPFIGNLGGTGCEATDSCDGGTTPPVDSGRPMDGGGIAIGTGGRPAMSTGGQGGTPADPKPDASVPPADSGPPKLDNGSACSGDDDCQSAHCDGVCCAGGDCCKTPTDCNNMLADGVPLACNDFATCSGSGGAIQCSNEYRCQAVGGEPNDSACDDKTIANTCGPYRPVFCTGEPDQLPPACPTACSTDADCDSTAHCDGICKPDVLNGDACSKDLDCASGHCSGGLCCNSGDCCRAPLDCPMSYRGAPTCDTITTCQGTRKTATCSNFICASQTLPDDTGCTNAVIANDCGLFADLKCTGGQNQQMQSCPVACVNASQCDNGAFCNGSACVERNDSGETCDSNAACESNFCGSNGLCCFDTGGLCCRMAADCPASAFTTRGCGDLATCSATITQPRCNNGGLCIESAAMPDPSGMGCIGVEHDCGPGYAPRMKTCPDACDCQDDDDCSGNASCQSSRCVVNSGGGPGSGGNGMPMAGAGGGP